MAEVGSDSRALVFPKARKEEKEGPSDAVTPKLYFKGFKRCKQHSSVFFVCLEGGGNFQIELTTEKIDSCTNFK